jgi:hypothetical protein
LSWGVTRYFEVAAVLDYFDALEFEGINHALNAGATHSAGCVSADDFGRDEERDFVDETRVNEAAGDGGAAFDEYALNRATTELVQNRTQI